MNDIFIISCYQFNITEALIKLLGEDRCYLVLDSLSEDLRDFHFYYEGRIVSEGRFGYYSIDEAVGRINMMHKIMEITNGNFDWLHVISQNDLPTAGFFNRENILKKGNEYIHIHRTGWMSNYFSISPELCAVLDSHTEDRLNYLSMLVRSNALWNLPGAPSESLWAPYVKDLPNRINTDLRLYTYLGEFVYGSYSGKLGHHTKSTSPLTFDCTDEMKHAMSVDCDYLFARKFDYGTDAYNWAYERALKEYKL